MKKSKQMKTMFWHWYIPILILILTVGKDKLFYDSDNSMLRTEEIQRILRDEFSIYLRAIDMS